MVYVSCLNRQVRTPQNCVWRCEVKNVMMNDRNRVHITEMKSITYQLPVQAHKVTKLPPI
jgi:hypothetical protein